MKLTYIQQDGSPPVGDGGDQYTGLDRFGRVIDQRWLNGSDVDQDRLERGQPIDWFIFGLTLCVPLG